MKKKEIRKIDFKKSILIMLVSQITIKLIGLLYKLYLTNKEGFGDSGNAIYFGAFQVYALILSVTSIGIPNAISKLVAEKIALKDNKNSYKILKVSFYIFGLIGFLGSCILFFLSKIISNKFIKLPETEIAIITLSPSIFFTAISSVLKGYFNGKENINLTARAQNIEQILKTIFTIIIVEEISIKSKNAIQMASGACLGVTISTIISTLYLFIIFKKERKNIWNEIYENQDKKNIKVTTIIKTVLKTSFPISIIGMLATTSKTIDTFTVVRILKNIEGEEIAKIQYGILSGKIDSLIALPLSLNVAFSTTMIPAIAMEKAKNNYCEMKKKIKIGLKYSGLIGLIATLSMSLFSKNIINILFPNANSGANMLKIASISIIFCMLTQSITATMQGIGKTIECIRAFGIGAVIKLFLNIILINNRRLKIYGAIISSIISNIIIFLICYYKMKKCMKTDEPIDLINIKSTKNKTFYKNKIKKEGFWLSMANNLK